MRNLLFVEEGFIGYDVADAPERHEAGIVTEAQNLMIVGSGPGVKGGYYQTRPGKRA